jgi:lipoprotein-anchoring transpeptidase ErfK/SrfK
MKSLLAPLALVLGMPLAGVIPAFAQSVSSEKHLARSIEPTVMVELNRSAKRIRVLRDNQEVASFPVAVGRPDTPTPVGEHTIFRMQKDPVWSSPWEAKQVAPSPTGPIGTRWMGFWYACGNRTSLDSQPPSFKPEVCKEIGFHGTGKLDSIGTAASNGCVRMFDRDAVALYEMVKEGTRVRVID